MTGAGSNFAKGQTNEEMSGRRSVGRAVLMGWRVRITETVMVNCHWLVTGLKWLTLP